MINRVLIRTKVVQLLYSYLLTCKEFKIEQAPKRESRDNNCAYSTYLDLLVLILELSGAKMRPDSPKVDDNKYLLANRVSSGLINDETLKTHLESGKSNIAKFDPIIADLLKAITKTSTYRSYIRTKTKGVREDAQFWIDTLETVILNDDNFRKIARSIEGYTNVGFDKGVDMLVYTLKNYYDSSTLLIEAKNSLKKSLDKAFELYHALLILPVELTNLQEQRLDNARHKYLPTFQDLNPNTRFIDNAFVKQINANPSMRAYLADNPISWVDDSVFLRGMLDKILSSELYDKYMNAESTDYETDCDFWRNVMKQIILPSDELAEVLEMKSVYWNDDLNIVGTFALKTMKQIAANPDNWDLLPQYKDTEDASFGSNLFVDTILNFETYKQYVDKFVDSKQWETERLAFMDIVIMVVAISEFLNFPQIPIAVTMNEYIEIANYYSTPRSGHFINGVLFSVVNHLKSEGKLNKN